MHVCTYTCTHTHTQTAGPKQKLCPNHGWIQSRYFWPSFLVRVNSSSVSEKETLTMNYFCTNLTHLIIHAFIFVTSLPSSCCYDNGLTQRLLSEVALSVSVEDKAASRYWVSVSPLCPDGSTAEDQSCSGVQPNQTVNTQTFIRRIEGRSKILNSIPHKVPNKCVCTNNKCYSGESEGNSSQN